MMTVLPPLTIAIANLAIKQSCLQQEGLYWLMVERAEDADTLCRETISHLPNNMQASLIGYEHASAQILDELHDQAGPQELAIYEIKNEVMSAALTRLTSEFDRIGGMRAQLLILRIAGNHWQTLGQEKLVGWIEAMRCWLRRHGCTLLIINHGHVPWLVGALDTLAGQLSGLAQLYRNQGSIHYLLHYWFGESSLSPTLEFELEAVASGFAVTRCLTEQSFDIAVNDQRLILAQEQVLEGAPALSEHWVLFESQAALRAHALQARAATVLLVADNNRKIDELASLLYDLRRKCGNALKLVVRETAPCLRYLDEQLLLASGASLIVPFGTNLSRFLTLLDSIQGHVWNRNLAQDADSLLQRLQPLPVRGVLSPLVFSDAVRKMWKNMESGEIAHQLLCLQVTTGLSAGQVLGQSQLRRFGDIACVVDGRLYLFLFACRADGIEQALSNIFRLSWQEMFIGYEIIRNLGCLDADGFRNPAAELQAASEVVNERHMEPWRQCLPLEPKAHSLAKVGARR